MNKKSEPVIDTAIKRVTGANNNDNDQYIIKKTQSKSVYFQERDTLLRSRRGSTGSHPSYFSFNTEDNSNRSSFMDSTTGEKLSINLMHSDRESHVGETTTCESPEVGVSRTPTKKRTKKRIDPHQALATRPKPPKPAHETVSLEPLTNMKIRRQLKADLRRRYADVMRECRCRSSSTKLYRATKHQVDHILGKQAAYNALEYDDYFNTRNFAEDTLPSFSELLMKVTAPSIESSTLSLPRPRSLHSRKKTKPDAVLQMLSDFYKSVIEDLKSFEKKTQGNFGHLLSKRPPKADVLTSFNRSITVDFGADQAQISTKGNEKDTSFLSYLSTGESSKTMTTRISENSKDLDEREEEDARYMLHLEEKHRNSQQALLSLYAIRVGKGEKRELEHLLDRFWAIYESRTIPFNHSDFSQHSAARWHIFANKVIDQAVRRLRANERARAKYTEFLYPELKKKKRMSFMRKASTMPGKFQEQARVWGAPAPTKCPTDVDLVEKVHQVEDERRRIQDDNYRVPTQISSSDDEESCHIHQYARQKFDLFHTEASKIDKVLKQIGKELVLPAEKKTNGNRE